MRVVTMTQSIHNYIYIEPIRERHISITVYIILSPDIVFANYICTWTIYIPYLVQSRTLNSLFRSRLLHSARVVCRSLQVLPSETTPFRTSHLKQIDVLRYGLNSNHPSHIQWDNILWDRTRLPLIRMIWVRTGLCHRWCKRRVHVYIFCITEGFNHFL